MIGRPSGGLRFGGIRSWRNLIGWMKYARWNEPSTIASISNQLLVFRAFKTPLQD